MDGGKGGGEQILGIFERRLTDNIEKLNFRQMLTPVNVKRIVEEADGYQPHLIAPEMGYRRLLQECLVLFKVSSHCLPDRPSEPSFAQLLAPASASAHRTCRSSSSTNDIHETKINQAFARVAPEMLARIPCTLASSTDVPARHCLGLSGAVLKSWLLAQGPADTAVEEVHSVLRQIVARTIESEDCKGLAQFTLLKREIATTAATALEKMKDDARKMVQTMVEMEGSYLTAEVFKEILSQSSNPEGVELLRTLSGRPVSLSNL